MLKRTRFLGRHFDHTKDQVAHFAIFEKLVFAIALKISRIPTENIEPKDSLCSKLQIKSICSIGILSILEVIVKMLNPDLAHQRERYSPLRVSMNRSRCQFRLGSLYAHYTNQVAHVACAFEAERSSC